MRGRRHKLAVSTFPFLAVLLCAMGSLILILLVMDRKAHHAAQARARHEAARLIEQSTQTEAAQRAELERKKQRARTEWEQKRDALHANLTREQIELQMQMRKVRDQFNQIAARLRYEQDTTTELRHKVQDERGRIQNEQRLLATLRSKAGQSEEQSKESSKTVRRMTLDLLQMEQALKDLKAARQREQHTFSVVPYHGRRGENRRPIYVECTPTGVVFHPGRRAMPITSREFLVGRDRPGETPDDVRSEVERRIARQRAKQAGVSNATPYLLLLVRPDGINSYWELQNVLKDLTLDFGYEFIDADWVLDFPEDDDQPSAQPWMVATKTPSAVVTPPRIGRSVPPGTIPARSAPNAGAQGVHAGATSAAGGWLPGPASPSGRGGSGTGLRLGAGPFIPGSVPGGSTSSAPGGGGVAGVGGGGSGAGVGGNSLVGGSGLASGSGQGGGEGSGLGGSGTGSGRGNGTGGGIPGATEVAGLGTPRALGSGSLGAGGNGQGGYPGGGNGSGGAGGNGPGSTGNGGTGGNGSGTGGNGSSGIGSSQTTGSGTPGNGFSGNGMGGNGAPGNGTPGNGMGGNGAPGNGGVSGNGMPGNGMPGNGVAGNGMPGNGTPGNGMGGNGVGGNGVGGNGVGGNGVGGNGTSGNVVGGNGAPGNGLSANGTGGNGTPGNGGVGGNGVGGNGAPGNGAPGNGMGSNGTGGNGAPGNDAPGNGAPGNGAPGNGAPGSYPAGSPLPAGTSAEGRYVARGNGGNGSGQPGTAGGASGNGSRSAPGGEGTAFPTVDPLAPRPQPGSRPDESAADGQREGSRPPRPEEADYPNAPRRRRIVNGGGGEGEPDDAGRAANRFATPSASVPKPRKPVVMRPAWVHGGRDWTIYVECRSDAVVLYPSEKRFTLAQAASDASVNPLVTAIQQMIARRQSGRRPGEPPFYPQVRLLVRSENVRTFLMVYPALEALPVPKKRQNLDIDDDVNDIVRGVNP